MLPLPAPGPNSINFGEFFSTGFKVGINYKPPTVVPSGDLGRVWWAICELSHSTAIAETWALLTWYLPSMPLFTGVWVRGWKKETFSKTHEDMTALEKVYEEVDTDSLRDRLGEKGREYYFFIPFSTIACYTPWTSASALLTANTDFQLDCLHSSSVISVFSTCAHKIFLSFQKVKCEEKKSPQVNSNSKVIIK